jgi:tetratricopeptide (TPR) repeat protein
MKTKPTNTVIKELSNNNFSEAGSLLFWSMMTFMVFYLFFTPFISAALFNGNVMQFESPIYSTGIWTSIFLIITSVFYFFQWRLRDQRDLLSIAIWLVPFSYWISFHGAASHQLASNMLLISLMYASFFLFSLTLSRYPIGAAVLPLSLIVSGYVLVLFGFLNMFGNLYAKDAVMITEIGLRITSVFQYANAYAAYLMAILFSSLFLIVNSRKWYWILLNALMLVPTLSSLWLTQSRGGYLLLPIILVLMLPLLSVARQLLLTLYLIIGVAASIPFMNKFIAIGQPFSEKFSKEYNETGKVTGLVSIFNAESLAGWSRLLLVSAIVGAIAIVLQRYISPMLESKLSKWNERRTGKIIFPVTLLVMGILAIFLILGNTGIVKLLPSFMSTRLENINLQQHSVLERGTVYKDSLKIVQDHPILGVGGGGWAALWEKYQNNPYIVRQAHNFFLQYAVDVGLLGLIFLLGLLVWIFYRYLKYTLSRQENSSTNLSVILFIFAISLLAHSFIDFELSYVYIAILVFICLGGLAAVPGGVITSKSKLFTWTYWRWIYPAFVGVIAIIILVFAITDKKADTQYKKAMTALNEKPQKPFQEILGYVNNALALKPAHPDMVAIKLSLMEQAFQQTKQEQYSQETVRLITQLEKNEPHSRNYYEWKYKYLISQQQTKPVLDLLQQAIVDFPWDMPVVTPTSTSPSFYERALDLDGQLQVAAINEHKPEVSKQYYDQAIKTHNQFLALIEHLKTLPKGQLPGREFGITPALQLSMGKIDFYEKKYEASVSLLKPFLAEDLSIVTNRNIALYYLASLKKQNQDDPALYDRLIASDAKVKDELDKLVAN